jgi:hypothetical protein
MTLPFAGSNPALRVITCGRVGDKKSVRVSVQLPEFIIFVRNDFAIGQHFAKLLSDCNHWIIETVNAD